MKTKTRPVNLNLFKMKFPVMAIVSGMHRISGVFLFLLLPLALYLLDHALHSEASFSDLQVFIALPWVKILLWVMISAISFHFIAGIRHMIMDGGFFESVKAGRRTAYFIILLEIVVMILVGVWLWG